MLSGRNVFLTGPPGSGKTYLLKEFIRAATLTGKKVAVTATTGVAATHLSGQTLNSWAGIGLGKRLKIPSKTLSDRLKGAQVLIIDEISMMNSSTLDLIDAVLRKSRKNTKPFGGTQVILVGDFFQLPPVGRLNKTPEYIYKASAWHELNLVVCYLNGQYRQNENDDLMKVLVSIRKGTFGKIEQKIVSKRQYINPLDYRVVRLFTHNYDADQINYKELNKLGGEPHRFQAYMSGNDENLQYLKTQILAPVFLDLKIDSEVMFVVNNLKAGYVNGSRGTVKEIKDDQIIVRLQGGGYVKARRYNFKLGGTNTSIRQFPLKLSWGLTIHKSQGMTLDSAVIDLSHAFTPNMGYVALSRLRSIEGLYLGEYNSMSFLINNEIRIIDREFKKLSDKISG